MAVVWRSTWGVTRLPSNEGQAVLAVATCLARMYWTPSALSRVPLALGNNTLHSGGKSSRIHVCRTRRVCFVNGVQRSLRPFPTT